MLETKSLALFVFCGCLQQCRSRDFHWNGRLGQKGFRRFRRCCNGDSCAIFGCGFRGNHCDLPGAVFGFSGVWKPSSKMGKLEKWLGLCICSFFFFFVCVWLLLMRLQCCLFKIKPSLQKPSPRSSRGIC